MCSYPASALTVIEGTDTIVIEDVIEDDVYVAGSNIIIKGTVIGDVVVAGGIVDVQGNITQDLIVAAGEVTISGNVGDDVRAASGTLVVNGNVQDDLISFSGETTLSSTGTVGGDITSASGQLSLLGDIGGNVTGAGGEVTLGGNVGENVDLEAGRLLVLPGAYIAGDLKYRSPESGDIPEGAVGKNTEFTEQEYKDDEGSVISSVIWWIIGYLALLLIGLLGIAIWPGRVQLITSKTPLWPGKTFLTGFAIFIASLVLVLLLFITVIGVPLGLILLMLVLTGLYIVRIFTAIWLGKYLFGKIGKEPVQEPRQMVDLALGLFVLLLVGEIPIIGTLVYLAATFIPIGNMYYMAKE